MESTPTIVCRLDTAQNIEVNLTAIQKVSANLSASKSIRASVSIPTQVDIERFKGSYEYTPSWSAQTIPTANKLLETDIKIDEIQTYETSNEFGTTFII